MQQVPHSQANYRALKRRKGGKHMLPTAKVSVMLTQTYYRH